MGGAVPIEGTPPDTRASHASREARSREGAMGDGAEGLVDAQSRIQERMDELEERRVRRRRVIVYDPERQRQLESLRLARTELGRQLSGTTHAVRREQLAQAIEELDRRIEGLEAKR